MLRRLALAVAALAVVLPTTRPVAAQDDATADGLPDGRLEAAETAYREGRFFDAVAAAERVAAARADDAEARYLLARLYFDPANPARDVRRARRAVAEASVLEPRNLLYLVARLELLREDSWNFVTDLLRTRQRAALARRILAIDSTNAFAHEELGEQAIRDYYQYRNAIALPGVLFADRTRSATRESVGDIDRPIRPVGTSTPYGDNEGPGDAEDDLLARADLFDGVGTGSTFYEPDRFDVASLTGTEGAGTISFAARAQRAYREAEGHLRAALDADPRRRSVYDHVARLAVLSGDYAAAAPDLAQMYVYFPDDPAMWLYTGLAQHRMGQAEAAEVAFREGLRRLPEMDRAAFESLEPLLPPDAVAAYRSDPEGVAQRYWASRDPRLLTAPNERLSEHYARLVAADLLYASSRLDLPGWETARGALFVRYGPPRTDVVLDGYAEQLEAFGVASILRDRPIAPRDRTMEQAANRFNVWDYGDFRVVFEDPNRTGEYRLYSPPAEAFATVQPGLREMDFPARVAERIRETPERYTFTTPGREVGLPVRVSALRGRDGQADLIVGYGVPLADTSGTGDVGATIRTGAFLVGPDDAIAYERRRTLFGLRAAQTVRFQGTRLWTSTETMTAPPGPATVSLEFETAGGSAAAAQRRTLDVPDFNAGGLQLSDIVLAYAVDDAGAPAPGRVVRNGLALQPAPWALFHAETPVHMYVEVYGLAQRDGRTDYEVEAQLVPRPESGGGVVGAARRLLGGRPRGVSTAFDAQGTSTDDWQSLQLDAAGQPAGLYVLTLVVRDRVSGASVRRETDLVLE